MATTATGFPFRLTPLTNITPFTYRDATTFMEKLERLAYYINNDMRAEFNAAVERLSSELQEGIEQSEALTVATKNEWDARFSAFMVDVTNQIAELNDAAVAVMVGNELSATREALSQFYVEHNELFVNVRNYGARPNSGDVTAQVQAAADDAAGRILYYSEPGDYIQHGHVVLKSGTTIQMVPGAQVRKLTGSTTYVAFVALAGTTTSYNGLKNISMLNCTFRGDLGAGVSVNALSAHRLSGLYVSGCKFLETSQNGHVFDLQGCENIVIENNEFRGIKKVTGRGYVEAIQLDSSVSTGTGFAEVLVQGELFDGTPTRNVTVRNNVFGTIRVNGVTYPAQSPLGSHSYVDGRPYTNITFTGNTIENVVQNDGGYPGILHFVAAQDVRISDNKVYGDNTATNTFVRFFRGGNAIPYDQVSNPNAVTAPPTITINPKNVTVDNNEITNLDAGTNSHLIWVYGETDWLVSNLVVTNNRFIGCQNVTAGGYLIQTTYTTGARIDNNRGYDCGTGFLYLGTSDYPSVSNNSSNGGTGTPINIATCVSPSVSNNRMRNQALFSIITGCTNVKVKDNEFGITANTAALKIIGPPAVPGYIHVIGNTLSSTYGSVATADSAIGISTGYTKGLVATNLANNYAVPADISAGVVYANNVAV